MGMSIGTMYLILYNAICCSGWATVLVLAIKTMVEMGGGATLSDRLCSVYDGPLPDWLYYVQTAALLEIVHAMVGLVRSPVFVTTMQVGSRIAALNTMLYSPVSQDQFGAGLMILSWSLVEVPRYLFYVSALITGDATKKTPYPLFWLRYSLFAVLYPTGITGELTVFLAAAKDHKFLTLLGEDQGNTMYWLVMFFPIVYVPGALPMIMNMAGNRRSAFKKRFAKPPPPARGLVFPQTDEKGTRSTTVAGKAVMAAALSAADKAAGEKVLKEKNWRFKYIRYFTDLVTAQCQSPEAALASAEAGLQKARDSFEFIAPDGTSCSLEEAMNAKNTEKFYTGVVKGTGSAQSATGKLVVPYQGRDLAGQELKDKVDEWVSYGTIEPSAGEAIKNCVDNPDWFGAKALAGQYFVLLGAGSAMGPFLVLMALGANVVAVDLDRAPIWKRLITIARNSATGGSITFPLTVPQEECKDDDEKLFAKAGSNLFTQTPMIRDWLLDLYPDKPLRVGSYAYLNGALHVQVSLAMDAICKDLSEKRKASLAYLCTPTDLHLIPKEAHDASEKEFNNYSSNFYCIFMRLMSNGKFLRKNAQKPVSGVGGDYYMVNGISVAQGPNYALAKRMQHWRAIVARQQGSIVSSNIAPATSTVSVIHKREFAWAYEGMPYFRPYEIFAPETSNAVMTALLFSDLNDPESVANPKTKLSNPNQLFSYGSFNGGNWRCAYEVDSIGEASVLVYFGRVARPYVMGAAALGVAGAAYVMAA